MKFNPTAQQKIIIQCLENLLQNAKTEALREDVAKRLADFRKSCQPKPKPTRPDWVDRF